MAAAATPAASAAALAAVGEPASFRPAEPQTERRVVTVLFADLVGFTARAEDRDPEQVREFLAEYFALAREVIERYGGMVEKFIGDAVMALWGAPIAREDDPERAVRAAMELVDSVRRLGSGTADEAMLRAGVLTGEAAVTIGAEGQGLVAGDLVNTASRLQSVAPPGTVLVGESTFRASDRAIAFEPAGEQVLKGKAAPVPAWRALRVVAERGGLGRSEGIEAPFVGRDDELRLLKEVLHAAGRERRVRLVSVTGQAGVGKSRLAWEFKYIDGSSSRWHRGRSPSYGEGITFWALGEMIRSRAGLAETDDERTTREGIAAMVRTHVSDETERAWIEPALLSLLGVESGVGSEQLFGAWRTFFERLAATAPVALVFEDLHWADTGTLDFIDHLLEWSRNVPLLIVTLARPELLERRPDWGAGKRSFTSIYLEPLGTEAMRGLLAGLVPGLPTSARDAIVARADGIPLYAVETVRMLLAQGRVVLEGGVYRPVDDLRDLAVPETLTALIAARLDELDAPTSWPTRPSSARASRWPPPPPSRASIPSRSSRGCGRSSGASCWSSRRTHAHRSGVSMRSSRLSSARSRTTRSRGATARSGTWPRPASSRASRPTSWPVRWPVTTWRPRATRRMARRRMPLPPRHVSRSAPRPSGRWSSVPTRRRSRFSSTPWP
jgi:class 3 adenylate cyclase